MESTSKQLDSVVVANAEGMIVSKNAEAEAFEDDYADRVDEENLHELVVGNAVDFGRKFQKVLETGRSREGRWAVTNGKEETAVHASLSREERECAYYVRAEFTEVETERGPEVESLAPSVFEDVDDEELEEVMQNVRVQSPDGKLTLEEIMLDLTVGHNEVEQYKQGALTLSQAVDERLEEEPDPNSTTALVLKEVKDAAFTLYTRIQYGDEQVNGDGTTN